MNKEIIKLLVEALESGEYQQTKGYLHTNNGYCCLGVLTDLYVKRTGNGVWAESDVDKCFTFDNGKGNYEWYVIPRDVMEWVGHFENDIKVPAESKREHSKSDSDGMIYLSTLNDSFGASFKDIARRLRKHYL